MPLFTDDGKEYETRAHQLLNAPTEKAFLSQGNSEVSNPTEVQATPLPAPSVERTSEAPIGSGTPSTSEGTPPKKDFGIVLEALKKTWPAKMVESFIDALKLPGQVYKGEIDLNTPEGVDKVTNLALNLGMGGLSTATLKPGVGLFGGRMSKEAVTQAEKMEKAGFSPTSVKDMTGLERGAEGMWRLESSDYKAIYNPKEFKNSGNARLEDVFKHDDFYKIYPEAKDIVVKIIPETSGEKTTLASYDLVDKVITIKAGRSVEQTRESILHELQHWIQDKEGFALALPRFLSPEFRDQIKGYLLRKYNIPEIKQIVKVIENPPKGNPNWLESLNKVAKILLDDVDYRLYRSFAHESEAENVALRSRMTPKEIGQSLGSFTEGIPRTEQVIMNRQKGTVQFGSEY